MGVWECFRRSGIVMEIVERDVVEEEGLFGVIDEVICGLKEWRVWKCCL